MLLKLIPILLASTLLTGCMWQTVTSADIKRAQHYCESSGSEVEQISAVFTGDETVRCLDGNKAVNPSLKTKD